MVLTDWVVAFAGIFSFGLFFLVHLVLMRWVRPEALLKSLVAMFLFAVLVHGALMGALCLSKLVVWTPLQWVCAVAISMLIYGLLSFNYVLCVFGPYETSIRMRLVREIGRQPGGILEQDLFKRYNDQAILEIRLRRLTGSGDIVEEGGIYRARTKKNIFFMLEKVAGMIRTWIG